jgi:MarR family transcriptional regulator, organic hydroperoxide resistance regulator
LIPRSCRDLCRLRQQRQQTASVTTVSETGSHKDRLPCTGANLAADARLRGRATRVPGALSLTHARALRVLAEQGPLSIGQLAAGTETTEAATTQLVNGLAAAGYVTRTRPPDNKRTTVVALTDEGRARHDQHKHLVAETLDAALTQYDAPALNSAAEILDCLRPIYDRFPL